jgi:hypothetical protein
VNATQPPREPDEESRALLRRIVERTAYRQIMVANIRGHGLKYLIDLSEKELLVRDLQAGLAALREVERLYAGLGGESLALSVRDSMERIPYPYSRLELAVCLALVGRAERLVAASYLDSSSAGMAAVARRIAELERPGTRMLEAQLAEFCAEAGNRPTAQQFFNRWLAIAFVAFGRPATAGDLRAVALGLRTQRIEEIVQRFSEQTREWSAGLGLTFPDPATLGIELPGPGAKHAARA